MSRDVCAVNVVARWWMSTEVPAQELRGDDKIECHTGNAFGPVSRETTPKINQMLWLYPLCQRRLLTTSVRRKRCRL